MGDLLWEQVRDMMQQRDEMESLVSEMMTTLTLPQNQHYIPEELKKLAKNWHKRFMSVGETEVEYTSENYN